jgi:peptidoglycan/LPS O-acetylase OafA/YrhL
MLSLIQGYRGFAAVLVVLYHASGMVLATFGEVPLLEAFGFGWSGVQFFFVLSGFIIYHVHERDLGRPAFVVDYARKRLLRVYPAYIVVTLALAPLWLFVPSFGEPYHKDVSALVLSLLLIPQPHLPHLGVAWTLIHEVMFYALFATAIFNRKLGLAVLVSWFTAVAIANLAFTPLEFPATYFLSANNLLFCFGMLAAAWKRDFGWPLFVAGNVLFLLTGALAGHQHQSVPLILSFGLASFMIIKCARRLDAHFRNGIVRLLGDASYSIYLVHFPVISAVTMVMRALGMQSGYGAFAVCVACGIGGGVVFHRMIEAPLLNYLRSSRGRVRSPSMT